MQQQHGQRTLHLFLQFLVYVYKQQKNLILIIIFTCSVAIIGLEPCLKYVNFLMKQNIETVTRKTYEAAGDHGGQLYNMTKYVPV